MYLILCPFPNILVCDNNKSNTYDSEFTCSCRNLRRYEQFRKYNI